MASVAEKYWQGEAKENLRMVRVLTAICVVETAVIVWMVVI